MKEARLDNNMKFIAENSPVYPTKTPCNIQYVKQVDDEAIRARTRRRENKLTRKNNKGYTTTSIFLLPDLQPSRRTHYISPFSKEVAIYSVNRQLIKESTEYLMTTDHRGKKR